MFVVKSSTHLIAPSLRQISGSRRFLASNVKSGMNQTSSKSSSGDNSSPFSIKEDLHGYGLDEQTVAKMKASLFKEEELKPAQPMDFTKEEKKMYEHPVRTGIDKFADQVEHGKTAQRSQNFTASKETTDRAAHITSSSTVSKAAHTADGLRSGIENAANSRSNSDDLSYRESQGFPKEPTMVDSVKDSMKEGMEKLTDKMSTMGQNLAGSMKGMEGVADSLSHMSMPKTVTNAAESIKEAASSIKDAIPKSASEAVETIKHAMPSMDSVKGAASSIKDAMPKSASDTVDSVKKSMPSMDSMPKSTGQVKDAVNNAKQSMPSMDSVKDTVKQSMPSMDSVKNTVKQSMPSMDSAKETVNNVKQSMPSMDSVKETVKQSMPSMDSAKETVNNVKQSIPSMDQVKETVKQSMPSMGAVKDTMNTVKESMPSMDQVKGMANNVKETATEKVAAAKDTMNAAAESTTGVFEQFKQGMATMKEAMKPVVDYSTEKLKEGAAIAQEKIPPMAKNLKDKAEEVMHSPTVESIKESVATGARGAFNAAKENVTSFVAGKSEAQKMNIKEETTTVPRSKLDGAKPKDQEMSSSDIYKP